MDSDDAIPALGSAYSARLIFGWDRNLFARDKKLSAISFYEDESEWAGVKKRPRAAACESRFKLAIAKLEVSFGPLSAAEKTLTEAGRMPREQTKMSTLRVGRSTYARGEMHDRSQFGTPVTRIVKFAAASDGATAAKVFGNYTTLMDGICYVTIDVIAKPQTK